MNTLKLKGGEEIIVNDFVPLESNLIKVRLGHSSTGFYEGIWACLPNEFMEDYDNDVKDNKVFRYVTLRNDSLNLGAGNLEKQKQGCTGKLTYMDRKLSDSQFKLKL